MKMTHIEEKKECISMNRNTILNIQKTFFFTVLFVCVSFQLFFFFLLQANCRMLVFRVYLCLLRCLSNAVMMFSVIDVRAANYGGRNKKELAL